MNKYKAIKVKGVKHDEHRYLMEQKLGRKLDRTEIVHHKNENPRDNNIDNLEVITLAEHARLHHWGRKRSDEIRRAQSERMKGRSNLACRKLSDKDVRFIKSHYIPRDEEFGVRALARKFNISHP